MRIDYLDRLAPEPGRVVVLRPTDACQAAADAAPVSPGGPSFLQSDHLAAYKARKAAAGVHRAWTGAAGEFDQPYDEAAFAEALTVLVRRHEGLRTWFDVSGDTPVRHLVAADDVAFEAVDVEAPTDWEAGWEDLLVGLFDERCTPDSWTPFLLGAIVREGGFTFFWGCDHAFTDGASQIMFPTELAVAYDVARGKPTLELPEVGSPIRYAAEEAERAATYTAESPEVREWTEIVKRGEGRLPQFPGGLGLAPGETAPVRLRDIQVLEGADTMDAFEQRCRAAGGRFTSGLFAALAVAEQRLTGTERYFGVTVMGTRSGDYAMSHGWFCNFAPVEFTLPKGAGFDEVLVAADKAFGLARELNTMPVHVAIMNMALAGVLAVEDIGSPQMLSYLDMRRFPGAGLVPFDTGIHFTGVGRTGNCNLWANRYEERLQLGVQSPDTPHAQRSVDAWFETVTDVFADIVSGAPVAGHDG